MELHFSISLAGILCSSTLFRSMVISLDDSDASFLQQSTRLVTTGCPLECEGMMSVEEIEGKYFIM